MTIFNSNNTNFWCHFAFLIIKVHTQIPFTFPSVFLFHRLHENFEFSFGQRGWAMRRIAAKRKDINFEMKFFFLDAHENKKLHSFGCWTLAVNSWSIITLKITAQDKKYSCWLPLRNFPVFLFFSFAAIDYQIRFKTISCRAAVKKTAYNIHIYIYKHISRKADNSREAEGDSRASFKLFTSQRNNEAIFRLV